MDWKKIIKVHKEIVKRGEDDFFTLASQTRSNRSSDINSFALNTFSGPWEIPLENIENKRMLNDIMAGQHEQFFIGGPVLFKNNIKKLNPIIYKEVNHKINKEKLILSPRQSKWMISPPVVRAILLNTHIDNFDDWLKEKIEVLKTSNDTSVTGIINIFFDDFPFLGEQFKYDNDINNWFLFTPPSRISVFNINLMRDYESLESQITKSAGGLEIFKEKQHVNKNSSTLLPLVELNSEQEKAVKSFLSKDKLNVVTGPPGTGKSQVVLSTLLNAWAQGKKVLFSSANNAAVDVIRERLDEFNAEFPLYVRAGAKSRNNIEEVLQQVLMLGQTPDEIDLQKINKKQRKLSTTAKEIDRLIESDKPKQITELYHSGQNAYSECLKAKSQVLTKEESINKEIKSIFKEDLTYSKFLEHAKGFNEWSLLFKESFDEYNKQNRTKKNLKSKILTNTQAINNKLQLFNLGIKSIDDFEWINKSQADNFKKINDLLENSVNELLLEDDPGHSLDDIDQKWDSVNDVNNSIEILKRIEKDINHRISNYENLFRAKVAAEKKLKSIQDECKHVGLNNNLTINQSYFTDWLTYWLKYQSTPKNFINKLPFGSLSRLQQKLSALEDSFRKTIPVKIWNNLGNLNDASRSKMSEYIELLEKLAIRQKNYNDASNNYEDAESDYNAYKNLAVTAKVPNSVFPKKIDWSNLLVLIRSNIDEANLTKKYFTKLTSIIKITKTIKKYTDEIFEIRSSHPLVRAWFKSKKGENYESVINQLSKQPDHINGENFKQFYDQKTLSLICDSWSELIDIYNKTKPIISEIEKIQSKEIFKTTIRKFPSNYMPAPQIESFEDIDTIEDLSKKIKILEKKYTAFISTGKDELMKAASSELSRALEQITSAAELLESNDKRKILGLIKRAQETSLDSWPQQEFEDGFKDFNEVMLKAKLSGIHSDIARLAFEKTKYSWFESLSKDDSLQDSITRLSRKLRSNKNIIPEDAFDDFKKALTAVPIWISTAQSSQSIPMIPELFDLVIIDEASQCTMTHALPLIFRGKSLAVIGDPDQLSSIPSLQQEEENAIIDSISYDDYPEQLKHFNNNVFSASFSNLYQAPQNQIMLREHFRSHPLIIGFSNLNIYFKKHKKPLEIKNPERYSAPDDGLSYIQVNGRSQKPNFGSGWINNHEVSAVVKTIKLLKDDNANNSMTMGVVTPYKKQAEKILEALNSQGLVAGVNVGTAHIYQGQEKDIMIFSTVVSSGMDPSAAMWISKPPNVLNVAMTRARRKLIIVGDMNYCGNNFSGEILGKLSEYCKKIDKLSKISMEQKKLFELLILNGIDPEVEYPIADMHVDFLVSSRAQNLVIEVDGDQHKNQKAHDESRDAALRSLNFKVLRFSARDVRETPASIIKEILNNIM